MDLRRHCTRATTLGTLAWVAWVTLLEPPLVASLLGLSPLVLAPLLLRAIVREPEHMSLGWRIAVLAQLPCAVLAASSFVLPTGPIAAVLTVPWAGVTIAMAFHGLSRIRRRRALGPAWALAVDAGLAFPTVGAGWLASSRLGYEPLGFSPIIVLLTAVHFHFAGFVLPIVSGLVARRLGDPLSKAAAVGVVAGVPLVAIGITYSPHVEVGGAFLTAIAAFAVGVGQIRVGLSRGGRPAALFALSGLSLMVAMVVAGFYAFGEFVQRPWPSIPEMIPMHGAINALGFGLLGAWAWNLGNTDDETTAAAD